ncbi:DctP family TRAP transporter solute-binding subunit [Anoxybacillus ayderensis]|uniref:DctP family TRAP transporter solute-binding subunit n=1 Tax=Anoxybacillus ayderensis TaxID=265546 RepID=UPI002E1FEAC4|nr:DctP family TRAP transporter solute-binding subunit [Anoxybacillus ayderensis]MED0657310.1 DctP family TRAP transporter solute-binding subunit [Anoxybacillus ayderensis]
MKKVKWGIFSIVIIISWFYWLIPSFSSMTSLPYDDEQEGLQDQLTIRFSHVVAEHTPKGLAAQKFATLVAEKSNGKIKVEIYANATLFTDEEEIEALKQGKVEMIAPAYSKLTTLIPEWQVLDLPFAFPNNEAVEEALKGKIGHILFSKLQSFHIKGLAFWENGFKQVTNSVRPIVQPNDFHGLRFRTMPSEVIQEQFRLLGAIPKVAPFHDTFRELYYKQVDGQENTISNIYSKRFYEVQPYMTISNHGYLGYVVLMNESFWNNLTQNQQQIIIEALNETTDWMKTHAKIINEKQLNEIIHSKRMNIHWLTDKQKKEWLNHLQPLYDRTRPQVGEQLMKEVLRIQQKYLQ